jgi:dTDP-4-amino-4,6-dideoxygalactose transaminase
MDSVSQTDLGGAKCPGVQVSAAPATRKEILFPFLDLKAQFAAIREEIMRAITDVMEESQFIMGPQIKSFESQMAAYVGTRAAVSCASGSDALLLALLALEIGPGDEVITTPFTFVATAGSVARTGAKPVFADIDPGTFNIDPNSIGALLTKRTRAIMPVHLFGLAADLEPILQVAKERNLAVIEDAAQAIGARYHGNQVGTLGTIGCFSFFPSKNLGGAGDGGMLTTNDAALADRLRLLRVHGSSQRYHYKILGTNSRLDTIQAAILQVKLAHLAEWSEARRQKAERYRTLFSEMELDKTVKVPLVPADCVHVYHQFVLRCSRRDELREFLRSSGIPTEIYYPMPLHLQPAFAYLNYRPGQLPESEAASREVLALPIYPELKEEHQVAVVQAIANFYRAGK